MRPPECDSPANAEVHAPRPSRRNRMLSLGNPRIVTVTCSLVLLTALILSTPANAQTERAVPGPALVAGSVATTCTPQRRDTSCDDRAADFQLVAASSQAFGFTVFQHA